MIHGVKLSWFQEKTMTMLMTMMMVMVMMLMMMITNYVSLSIYWVKPSWPLALGKASQCKNITKSLHSGTKAIKWEKIKGNQKVKDKLFPGCAKTLPRASTVGHKPLEKSKAIKKTKAKTSCAKTLPTVSNVGQKPLKKGQRQRHAVSGEK